MRKNVEVLTEQKKLELLKRFNDKIAYTKRGFMSVNIGHIPSYITERKKELASMNIDEILVLAENAYTNPYYPESDYRYSKPGHTTSLSYENYIYFTEQKKFLTTQGRGLDNSPLPEIFFSENQCEIAYTLELVDEFVTLARSEMIAITEYVNEKRAEEMMVGIPNGQWTKLQLPKEKYDAGINEAYEKQREWR